MHFYRGRAISFRKPVAGKVTKTHSSLAAAPVQNKAAGYRIETRKVAVSFHIPTAMTARLLEKTCLVSKGAKPDAPDFDGCYNTLEITYRGT